MKEIKKKHIHESNYGLELRKRTHRREFWRHKKYRLKNNCKGKNERQICELKFKKIRNYEKENIKKEREGWTSRKGKRRIRSPNKRSRFDNNSLVVDSKSFFEFWNPCPSFTVGFLCIWLPSRWTQECGSWMKSCLVLALVL